MKDHFLFSHHDDLDQMVQLGIENFESLGVLLISGESGTGKSDLAAKIHKQSSVNHNSYLSQDAAGLANNRFESQMFGHARGAFSSAVNAHAGLLEVVGRGTLCIESLEDLTLENQARMLRFLESNQYRPVGATLERQFKGRLIFTSRNSPRKLMEMGALRSDFFYRISQFEIKLPPLHRRPLDFDSIFRVLVSRIRNEVSIPLRVPADEEMDLLRGQPIEGNYHGLRNLLQQAMIQGRPLDQTQAFEGREPSFEGLPDAGSLKADLQILEAQLLARALKEHPHSRKSLARHLGISLRSLMYKLKDHGLS